MNELEIRLMEIMVKLIVRYPDGLSRIQACLENVVKAGFEIAGDPDPKEDIQKLH